MTNTRPAALLAIVTIEAHSPSSADLKGVDASGLGNLEPQLKEDFMFLLSHPLSGGVFMPDELTMIRRVIDTLDEEGLLPSSLEERERFCCYILGIYGRGLVIENKLLGFARAAARQRSKETVKRERVAELA